MPRPPETSTTTPVRAHTNRRRSRNPAPARAHKSRHRPRAPLPAGRNGQNLAGTPLDRAIHVQARLTEGLHTNYSHFMERWGVSRSTVKRDMRYMRDRLNMPIAWDNAKKTFYFSEPFDALPAFILGPRDALTLALAGRMCDVCYGSAFGERLDEIFRKIAPLLGSSVAIAADSLTHIHAPPVQGALDDFEHFIDLLEAVHGRRELRLRYAKPESDAPEDRVVHPLKLVRRRDLRWVLIGYDTARHDLRTFVLSRIDSVETTERSFQPPDGFDIEAYVRNSMGAFASEQEHEARLALDAHAAYYAREAPWHGSQRLRDLPDGRVEMTLRVNHLIDVKNAVLGWGEHVEVLAPAELRQAVRDAHRAALARYEDHEETRGADRA